MKKYYAEVFGTFLLTASFGLTTNFLAVGLVLAALVYVLSDYSDSHFNPAVSLAAFLLNHLSLKELTGYTLSQVLGALFGALFSWWISGAVFAPEPSAFLSLYEFGAIEVLFSFLYVFLFITIFYNRRRRNPTFGLIIGLTLGGCYMIAEPIAGSILNPSMSLAFSLLDILNQGYSHHHLFIYAGAPLLSGILASLVIQQNN